MAGTPDARDSIAKLAASIGGVMRGQDVSVRQLLAAFAAGGHVLLEDKPGTGKTTLAKALARSIGAEFRRVQFTPDLLPSDIVGVSVFDPKAQRFEFHQGPIFTQILLADEINRASPRTQSALLEAMGESQVSVDGKTYPLPLLFFVIATQNPVEFEGTYPLPEAQMDRFMVRFSPGYVDAAVEAEILTAQERRHPLDDVSACVDLQAIHALRRQVLEVRISPEIKRYIVELVRRTRALSGVVLGASPRASLALMKVAQAAALMDGREFVGPEHVQEMAVAVIAHRLLLDPEARFSGASASSLVEEILKSTAAPA